MDNDNIINYKLYVPSICIYNIYIIYIYNIYIYNIIYIYICICICIYIGVGGRGSPPSHMMGMFESKALRFKMIN